MSKCMFKGPGFQFSFQKIYLATWRPLEADSGGWSGTNIGSNSNMTLCMSTGMIVRARISILISKIISGHLEATGGWPGTNIEVTL